MSKTQTIENQKKMICDLLNNKSSMIEAHKWSLSKMDNRIELEIALLKRMEERARIDKTEQLVQNNLEQIRKAQMPIGGSKN